MDPNACLRRIATSARPERDRACEDLHAWIARGGFHPDWNAYPTATAYYCKRYGLGSDMRS